MIEDEVGNVKRVIDTQLYAVKADSVVRLTVTIGEAQQGGTSYLFEDKTVVGDPNFTDQPLNPDGHSIKNTIMECLTKVMDIQEASDHTSVTFTLRGGVKVGKFTYKTDVSENHGFAVYFISFVFV